VPTVWVRAGDGRYPVVIEAGGIARSGERIRDRLPDAARALVVADRGAAERHGSKLRAALRRAAIATPPWFVLPSEEKSKSLAGARRLYEFFHAGQADRWTPVVILGGGVAGDLAGFAAATYLRGLPVIHVPTTVVAQVDSSIGGKNAANFSGAKNLIGSFHPPALVIADPDLLATLSERDLRAGLAEAVKVGITLRPDLLELMETETEALLARDPEVLTRVVAACVEAKGEIVARDERDEDVRAILNYGHTVGHAVEGAAGGKLRHGEAVAVGMNAAAWIGEALGVAEGGLRERQNLLLTRLGLKLEARGVDKGVVLRNLKLDKKVRARRPRVVLTLQVGGASVWPLISARLLRNAVNLVTA
jgi:3-dehydroquinate synthase